MRQPEYDSTDITLSVIMTVAITILCCGGIFSSCNSLGHTQLGSKHFNCFANNTCREKLICLHGDGHEPGTCVSEVHK